MFLFIKDTAVLFTMLPYLPNVFLPFKAAKPSDEFYMNMSGARSACLQALLFVFESLLLIIALPTILLLPGIGIIAIAAVASALIYVLTWPLHGASICPPSAAAAADFDAAATASATKTKTRARTRAAAATAARSSSRYPNERWFFVNGCATDYDGLQKNVDLLSSTFGREVTGIYNKSFGLIGDLLECLIQRCFNYKTHTVRMVYTSIKPLITDPRVSKIVLIGHSQGGIIISMVLDQLFAELPPEGMQKLEVYTFGSAASHFPNPAVSLDPVRPPPLIANGHVDASSNPANQQLIIPYIEHYANEYDMVPRWGVLHCVSDIQSSLYAGSVFVRLGASGHMFNQHYLTNMFPTSHPSKDTPDTTFLDRPATVSPSITTDGGSPIDNIASSFGFWGVWRADSWLKLGDGKEIHLIRQHRRRILTGSSISSSSSIASPVSPPGSGGGGPFGQDQSVMVFSRTSSGLVVGEKASGKTVRELSRLWKYLGGASPED